jgi:hypothetical protein
MRGAAWRRGGRGARQAGEARGYMESARPCVIGPLMRSPAGGGRKSARGRDRV